MSDTTLTDMTSFLERHDRQSRRALVATLSASLLVSAVVFAYGARTIGGPGALPAALWFQIVTYPLLIAAFLISVGVWARRRPTPPGGRFVMSADDARNVARVANAGFVFTAGFGAVMIVSQAGTALGYFGALPPSMFGDWAGRAFLVALGALSIYLGNVWPRIPTPRAPEHRPATRMRYNRLWGWLMVISGLLLALPALLLPIPAMFYAVGVVSILVVLATVALAVVSHLALKSRSGHDRTPNV